MSVPGRIGIILIIALALIDAIILVSGAKRAASAFETHTAMQSTVEITTAKHEPLLSTALREINLFRIKSAEKPAGI